MAFGEVYLFDSGRLGELIYNVCKNELSIKGFIDNDPAKIGTVLNGVPIYSLSQVSNANQLYIVISANQHNNEIYSQLTKAGFKHGTDFVYTKNFFVRFF